MKKQDSKFKTWLFVITTAFLLLAVILLGWPESALAQVPPPGLPDGPEQTPIDGGLGILAALGGAYAIKKLRNKE